MLEKGAECRIFTARVGPPQWYDGVNNDQVRQAIGDWCEKHIGQRLLTTHEKDKDMFALVDDRAIQVQKNTGKMRFYVW
jgi:hypothetical protein